MSSLSVIEPARGWSLPHPRELWHYRDLLYFLVRRDLAVRYKQTLIGAVWAILQPVLLAIIFAVFLELLFNRPPSGDIPYPVFLLCGFTMWVYFAQAVQQGSQSTVASAPLISKVYFPRVLIPLAAIIPPVVDFLLAFVVLVTAILLYGLALPLQVILAPFVVVLAMMVGFGLSLILSALVVRYRDVQLAIPLAMQALLYSSAVIYPLSTLPESAEPYMALNPVVGIMETFRWTVLPGAEAPGLLTLVPVGVGIVLLIGGFLYFQRAERSFADVI